MGWAGGIAGYGMVFEGWIVGDGRLGVQGGDKGAALFASGACDDKATCHRSVGVIGAVRAVMAVGSDPDSQDVPMVDMVLTHCLCLRRCGE